MKKRFLAVILALALCLGLVPTTAFADGSRDYDVLYPVVGGNLCFNSSWGQIVDYKADCDDDGNMLLMIADIPSTINGIPVTGIMCETFVGSDLTSVTIPSSVTRIDYEAFACKSLTKISVDPNNPNYTSVDGVLFSKDMTVLHTYPAGKQGAYTIPSSVTSFEFGAFRGCTNLTSVTIPSSMTCISSSFSECTSLTSVTIPLGVTSIPQEVFYNCIALKDVYYAGTREQWKEISIGDSNNPLLNATIHYNSAIAKFPDLKPSGFYVDAVEWAVEKNITTGKTATTFSPDEKCTHGQILTFLWRAAGEPESSAQSPITLKGNEYYAGAVRWAAEKGMIGANFNPNAPCNRAYAVLYIWQAKDKPAATSASPFTDVPAHWSSAPAVAWAVDNGVTTGATETTFNPSGICNRGQIVTFLYRAYK